MWAEHIPCTRCGGRGTVQAYTIEEGEESEMTEKKERFIDPDKAFRMELMFGFFVSLLGMGYIFAGRVSDGIKRLVLWLIFLLLEVAILDHFFGRMEINPLMIIPQIAIPLWSANSLKKDILAENRREKKEDNEINNNSGNID